MGLLDIDRPEEDGARVEKIKSLVTELNDAAERQRRDLAAIEAQKQSALEWLEHNRALVIGGYEALVGAIVARDAELTENLVRTLGGVAGLVVNIPVDMGAGNAVTMAEIAAVSFEYDSSTARTIRLVRNDLPQDIFKGRDASVFLNQSDKVAVDFSDQASLWERFKGERKQAQLGRIAELSKELEDRKALYPAELAKISAEKDMAVEMEKSKLQKLANYHLRLRDSMMNGDTEEARAALKDMDTDGMADDVMAIAFHDGNGKDINLAAAALESFERGEDKAEIYLALVRRGVPPQPEKVIAATIGTEGQDVAQKMPLAGPFKTILEDIYRNKGLREFEDTVLSPYEGKGSLLERAASDDALLQALLAPSDRDLVRAALLLKAAEASTSEDAAGVLKEKAMALAGGGTWLHLSDKEAFRLTSVGRVANTGGNSNALHYAAKGATRDVPETDATTAAAVVDFLARQPGFVRVADDEVFRPDQTVMVAMGRDSADKYHFDYLLRDGVHNVFMEEARARDILSYLEKEPGWLRAGSRVFNAANIDNIWVSGNGEYEADQTVEISFIAAGKTYKLELKDHAAKELLQNLVEKGGFIAIGQEFLNPRTVGNIWFESKASIRGDIKYSTGLSKGIICKNVLESEAVEVMDKLAALPGFIKAGDYAIVKPDLFDAMSAQAGVDKLVFGIEGARCSVDMPSAAARRLVSKFATAARRAKNPDFVQDEPGSLTRVPKISSAWYSASKGKFQFVLSGKDWGCNLGPEQAQEVCAALLEKGGFLTRKDGTLMNMDAVDAIWHDGKVLGWMTAGGKWSSSTVDEKEGPVLIAKAIDPAYVEENPAKQSPVSDAASDLLSVRMPKPPAPAP